MSRAASFTRREALPSLRQYRWRRRIAIPAIAVMALAAVTLSGGYLLKEMLPTPSGATAELNPEPPRPWSVMEAFDNLPLTSAIPGGWEIVSGSGRFSVDVVPTSVNRSGRLEATGDDEAVVACRALSPPNTRTLTLSLDLSVDAAKPHDVLFLAVGPGPRPLAATVGIGHSGRFTVVDGSEEVTFDNSLEPKTWYQMTLVLHAATRTYDWEVGRLGGSVFSRIGMHWSPFLPEERYFLCLSAPPGPGTRLYVDNLQVSG